MRTDKKTWFITGASRGMGVDFARAALAAGHAVVATGRNPDAVARAVGASDDLLVVRLDVTRLSDADAPRRADERHRRQPAGHARAALRAHRVDLVYCGAGRLRVLHRLLRVQV